MSPSDLYFNHEAIGTAEKIQSQRAFGTGDPWGNREKWKLYVFHTIQETGQPSYRRNNNTIYPPAVYRKHCRCKRLLAVPAYLAFP